MPHIYAVPSDHEEEFVRWFVARLTNPASVKGGPGSGYYSEPGDPHRGRPGQRGGSLPDNEDSALSLPAHPFALRGAPSAEEIAEREDSVFKIVNAGNMDGLGVMADSGDFVDLSPDDTAAMRNLRASFPATHSADNRTIALLTKDVSKSGYTFEGEPLSRQDVGMVIDQWEGSSSTSTLQQSISEALGVPLSTWQQKQIAYNADLVASSDVDSERHTNGEVQRAVISALYRRTQATLRKAGVKYLRVYRGTSTPDGSDGVISAGQKVSFDDNAAASWSLDAMTARTYASGVSSDDKEAVVISAIVPAERILSMPTTGFGRGNRVEVVVLGGSESAFGYIEKVFRREPAVKGGPGSGYFDPHYGRPGKRGGSTERDEGNEVYEGKVRERAQENAGWWADQMAGLAEPPAPPTPLVNQMAGLAGKTPEKLLYGETRRFRAGTIAIDGVSQSVAAQQVAILDALFSKRWAEGGVTAEIGIGGGDQIDHLRVMGVLYEDGEKVGTFKYRVIGDYAPQAAGDVYFQELELYPPFQGGGAAAPFLRAVLETARASGGKKVGLLADITIGTYAWAKFGFNVSEDEMSTINARFRDWALDKANVLSSRIPQFSTMKEIAEFAIPGVTVQGGAHMNQDVAKKKLNLGKAFLLTDPYDGGPGQWEGEITLDALESILGQLEAKQAAKSMKGGPGSGYHSEPGDPHRGRPGQRGGSLPDNEENGEPSPDDKIVQAMAQAAQTTEQAAPEPDNVLTPEHLTKTMERLMARVDGGEHPKDINAKELDEFLHAANDAGWTIEEYDTFLVGGQSNYAAKSIAIKGSLRYLAWTLEKARQTGFIDASSAAINVADWFENGARPGASPEDFVADRTLRSQAFSAIYEEHFYSKFYANADLRDIANAIDTIDYRRKVRGLADSTLGSTRPFRAAAKAFVEKYNLLGVDGSDSHIAEMAAFSAMQKEIGDKFVPAPLALAIIEEMGQGAPLSAMYGATTGYNAQRTAMGGLPLVQYIMTADATGGAADAIMQAYMSSPLRGTQIDYEHASDMLHRQIFMGTDDSRRLSDSTGLLISDGFDSVVRSAARLAQTPRELARLTSMVDSVTERVREYAGGGGTRYDPPKHRALKEDIEAVALKRIGSTKFALHEWRDALAHIQQVHIDQRFPRSPFWNMGFLRKAHDSGIVVGQTDVAFAMMLSGEGETYIPGLPGSTHKVDKIASSMSLDDFVDSTKEHIKKLQGAAQSPLEAEQLSALLSKSPHPKTYTEVNVMLSRASWMASVPHLDALVIVGNAGHLGDDGFRLSYESLVSYGAQYSFRADLKREWFDPKTFDPARFPLSTALMSPAFFPDWSLSLAVQTMKDEVLAKIDNADTVYDKLELGGLLGEIPAQKRGILDTAAAAWRAIKYPEHETYDALTGEKVTLSDPSFEAFRRRSLSNSNNQDLAGVRKHEVATALSAATGLTYDRASEFVRQWAYSSNGSDMRSLGIQHAAAEEFADFGVSLSEWQNKETRRAEEMGGDYMKWILGDDAEPDQQKRIADAKQKTRTALRSMYERTQAMFADAGVTHVRLYRGTSVGAAVDADTGRKLTKPVGRRVAFDDNALASWSLTPRIAGNFGNFVVSAVFPVKQILSTPLTGFGCLGEHEVVVMGTKGNMKGRVEKMDDKFVPETKQSFIYQY